MGVYAITGAASGIGKAVTQMLQQAGHQTITIDRADADIVADLSSVEACNGVVDQLTARLPDGLDGLVPCAGVGPETPNRQLLVKVNFFGSVNLVEGLLPLLQKKRGAVVLISSNSSQMQPYDETYIDALLRQDEAEAIARLEALGDPMVGYGGGKQALGRWMRHQAARLAKMGIRINAIAPGYTETGMTASAHAHEETRAKIEQFLATIPLGRAGKPEDQADAVCFLLSEKASFITGSVLFVDGGHDSVFRPDRF